MPSSLENKETRSPGGTGRKADTAERDEQLESDIIIAPTLFASLIPFTDASLILAIVHKVSSLLHT
jgi:hypothetical protein